jgi:predicted CXXCH cytochrome family protein
MALEKKSEPGPDCVVKCKITSRKALLLLMAIAGLLMVLPTSGFAWTKHQWLNFFFDGVPAENSITNSAGATTNKNSSATPIVAAPVKPHLPTNILHKPFADGNCEQCHGDMTISPKITGSLRPLCFKCHKDFVSPMKVKHQPVEDGDCLSCHEPHESTNKFLLKIKGNDLCLSCHDDPLAGKKYKHEAVEMGDCLDCHSPHATNFKGLLKQSVKETCESCHDDIAKKKDVHQPVDDGDCLACHDAHASNNKNLVKKTGANLCWDCHDNFLEKAKFTHDAVDNCSDCHNPHSTDEKSLLKKNVNLLCADCHDQKEIAAVKAHVNIGAQLCTTCHDPHVGTNQNLLKPAAQNPEPKTGGAP